jgi:N-acetylneuraminate synthase
MCGAPGTQKRMPPAKEIQYLDSLVRGVYARRDLPEGHVLADEDVYLAIPLLQGQISCRELMRGEELLHALSKDAPIRIDDIDSPYASVPSLRELIYRRGLPEPTAAGSERGTSDGGVVREFRPAAGK